MRYAYLGDRWTKHFRPDLVGRACDPVMRTGAQGREAVTRGKNRNQLVRFDTGELSVVPGRQLRLSSTLNITNQT